MRRVWLGSDEKNRPKRRVLRCLGHTRYVIFFSSRFTQFFFVYLGSICIIKGQEGLGWAAIGKTGPNDASCVVWAIGKSTFYFFVFYSF